LLAGLPPTAAWPVRRPGLARADAAAQGGFTDCECRLPASLTDGLRMLARRRGWTLGTLLQGAWALVQAAHSACHDVVFGVAVSGRQGSLRGIDSVVGLVAGVVPLRLQVLPGQAADAWLDGVQRAQFASRRHENLTLDAMRERGGEAAAPGASLATCFVLSNYPDGGLDRCDGGLQVRALDFHTRPDFPLTICLRPGPQLLLRCSADLRFLQAADLQGLLDGYAAVLAALRADAAQPVAALLQAARPVRGPTERQASAARASAMARANA
jgi:non-ribosomal peptide synthetase component F